jgi:hypothetical protein
MAQFEVGESGDLETLEARLREGRIDAIQDLYSGDVRPLLALLERVRPPGLRELVFGQCNPRNEVGRYQDDLGDLSGLWVHRGLEKLVIEGKVDRFGAIDAPRLRHFDWTTLSAEAEPLAEVAAARWPELESLVLYLGVVSDDIPAEVQAMRAILDGRGLPRLRHLGLLGGAITEGLCRYLPRCGILPQLRTLDLSGCYKPDRERRALKRLRKHPAFQHLQKLTFFD